MEVFIGFMVVFIVVGLICFVGGMIETEGYVAIIGLLLLMCAVLGIGGTSLDIETKKPLVPIVKISTIGGVSDTSYLYKR